MPVLSLQEEPFRCIPNGSPSTQELSPGADAVRMPEKRRPQRELTAFVACAFPPLRLKTRALYAAHTDWSGPTRQTTISFMNQRE